MTKFELTKAQARSLLVALHLADEHLTDLVTHLNVMLEEPAAKPSTIEKLQQLKKRRAPRHKVKKIQPSPLKSEDYPFQCRFGHELFYATESARNSHERRQHKGKVQRTEEKIA